MNKSLFPLMAFIAIIALVGCSPSTPQPQVVEEPQQTEQTEQIQPIVEDIERIELVVAAGGIADTLDPQMSTSSLGLTTYAAVFDALTQINPSGEIEPSLAETWTSLDPNTWEFKIRTGVIFQNGQDLTAQDVKFSLERILNPDTNSPILGRISTIQEVEVVNGQTILIKTSEPDPILLRRLSAAYIIPQAYFEEVQDQGFNENPIGTGPFSVKEYSIGDYIVLEAFDDSWRGTPNISGVNIRVLPESSVRVAALQTGEVDVVHNLPVDQARDLEGAGFQISYAPQARCMIILAYNTRETPLDNKEVRQAINYAVDKESIIDNIMQGYASPCKGQLIGDDGFGHNPNLQDYPYDIEKAKELMASAGYPDGFEIEMTGTEGFYVNDRDWEVAIIGYLQEIGIDVNFRTVENAVYVPMIYDIQHGPLFPVAPNYFPAMDGDFAFSWFDSENPVMFYKNDEFDELFRKSKQSMDPNERESLMQQASEVLFDDPPAIFLFRPPELLAISSTVQGVEARPDLIILFDKATKTR